MKWEYTNAIINLDHIKDQLTQWGGNSWELVAFDFNWSVGTGQAIFKRPKVAAVRTMDD